MVIYNLIFKMTSKHFCHILFIKASHEVQPTHKGRGLHRAPEDLTGEHFGRNLQQTLKKDKQDIQKLWDDM